MCTMNLRELQIAGESRADNGESCDAPPKNFNREKFNRGRKFYLDNLACHSLVTLMSLVVGLNITNLLEPLVISQKSDTKQKALRRYLDTFRHIFTWHNGEMWSSNDSLAYDSVAAVRKMHNNMRKHMSKRNNAKVHLSQYDMALVQFGFMGYIILYPKYFYLRHTEEDLDNYVYFWYIIGYLLGVEDEFNICSVDYRQTYNLCKQIELDVILPTLHCPPQEAHKMATAVADGFNILFNFKLFTPECIIGYLTYYSGNTFWEKLSFLDMLRCYCLQFFLALCYYFPPFLCWINFKIVKGTRVKEKGRFWVNQK